MTSGRIDLGIAAAGSARWTEVSTGDLDVPTVPLCVVRGAKDGPRCSLIAGVHGDEYDGILAAQEIARELDPHSLAGNIVVVPVANPLAFRGCIRKTPEDGKDLNRVFPGKPDGTVTERLAALLCDGVLSGSDLVFSLHGGTTTGSLTPWIEFLEVPDEVGTATFAAAKASNFPDLIALPYLPGVLQTALAERRIPTIEGEVGGRGITERSNVEYYKQRIQDVLAHLGISGPSGNASKLPRVWRLQTIAAQQPGILIAKGRVGSDVAKGEAIGRIVDGIGRTAEEICAPNAGRIGALRQHAGVMSGDTVATLWVAADRKQRAPSTKM